MKVLRDIRVVSLASNLPGPLAVARLAELGATITKIEHPEGDALERSESSWYRSLHQDVEVRRLDLKEVAARAELDALLESAELLLTANRTAALERLGLGWEKLHQRFPCLSQVAIVSHSGAEENRPGHDLLYQANHGLVEPPALPRTCIADLGGALEAVIAALQLVLLSRADQVGRRIVVSLDQSAAWFAEPLQRGLTAKSGILGGNFAGYQLYEASDGWIAVAALEPHFQRQLAKALGLEKLDAVPLQSIFRTRSAEEWMHWAREHDLPIAKVNR